MKELYAQAVVNVYDVLAVEAPATPAPGGNIQDYVPTSPNYGPWSGLVQPVTFVGGILLGLAALISLLFLFWNLFKLAVSQDEDKDRGIMRSIKKNLIIFVICGFASTVLLSFFFGLLQQVVNSFGSS